MSPTVAARPDSSVAKNQRRNTEKLSAVCPHCGHVQDESVLLRTTICRKCRNEYPLEHAPDGQDAKIVKTPGFFDKLNKMMFGIKEREVVCFTCAHTQILSTEAQSTMCPDCGSYIDLRDFKITTPFSRSVQTAGELHIAPKGDVTSTKIACGSAKIEGSLRGYLVCTGTATLCMKGRMTGGIDCKNLVVDKKADVEFVRTMKCKEFTVRGKSQAKIIADKVIIDKGGWLEGTVYARAITVEKGGVFCGELFIGQDELDVAPEPIEEDKELARFDEDDIGYGRSSGRNRHG